MPIRSKGLLLAAMSMALIGEKLIHDDKDKFEDKADLNEPPLQEGLKRFYFNNEGKCSKGQHIVYFDLSNERIANEVFKYWLTSKSKYNK